MLGSGSRLPGVAVVILLAAFGCGEDRERPSDQVAVETPAVPAVATTETSETSEHMRSTLASLVEAQSAFFQEHGRFAEEPTILIQDYGFQPVGGVTAAINFDGTAPTLGYLATASHPYATERCEIHHGRASEEREFTGEIVCREGAGEPMPTDVPLAPIQ